MNKIELKPINDLLGESFYVPSYQRGYRWTETEVNALLNDILEFYTNNKNAVIEPFYCLQPLVVSKKNDQWILIDGQQRLTTIFLILDCLKPLREILGKGTYSIEYETRKNSQSFLKNIDYDKEYDNVDYYHICLARKAIEKWFSEKDGVYKNHILQTLTSPSEAGINVRVIWYEIDNKNAIEIFTRINVGKIPLTNAELIKALFLRKRNFLSKDSSEVLLKQIEIASQWDVIENTLRNDNFWYFIKDNNSQYDTRIEYIFDVIKKKSNSDEELFTFLKYNEEFEMRKNNITEIWKEVMDLFLRFKEWYNYHKLYHLVGYVITTKIISIEKLINKNTNLKKSEFESYIKDKIKKHFEKYDIDSLNYNQHSTTIKHLLLLFNVEYILKNDKSNLRFPFDEYLKNNWDLEHISSINSEMPKEKNAKSWMMAVYEYFIGTKVTGNYEFNDDTTLRLINEIKSLLEQEDFNYGKFEVLFNKVLSYFKEDEIDGDVKDSIGNLCLLDAYTNRAYKNAIFPVKRKWILENEANAMFVPLCTKNVFVKYYSNKFDQVMFWQQNDIEDYQECIKSTLKFYLN
ncbi:DUF262 domain-containing protein [Chryseobacterium sp. JJR-5R]|uniref:DUF262 domain-containing protein n=1 Tax=Chryseobacterium sp. JJR-5R TaxID=3093923 RepID=UPI002A763223|nr:DUF262 domain-containing protein [Chryseobacterium sp. JJR-5R]WPO81414.1 DUF262 domain-containing protein [Chryseobacterium sp. JJR-5R]